MTSLALPARAVIDPVDGVRESVEARRWVWPLLLLCLAVSVSGTAYSLRWDPAPSVTQQLQQSGELGRQSEAEIDEAIETAGRKALVGGIAKGVFAKPLTVLALAALLWFVGWLFGVSAHFAKLMTVAAVAMLPIALFHFIYAGCLLFQHSVTEAQALRLVPSNLGMLSGLSPKLQRVLSGVDFFNLWSAGLLGLGFSYATGMRRSRALVLAAVLYLMYVGVFLVGLPAMGGGAK
jgi:hypothetical protein